MIHGFYGLGIVTPVADAGRSTRRPHGLRAAFA